MEIAADIDDFKRRIFSARRKAGAVSGVFFKVRGNLPMVLSVKNWNWMRIYLHCVHYYHEALIILKSVISAIDVWKKLPERTCLSRKFHPVVVWCNVLKFAHIAEMRRCLYHIEAL